MGSPAPNARNDITLTSAVPMHWSGRARLARISVNVRRRAGPPA
jgi:hypothetical protein